MSDDISLCQNTDVKKLTEVRPLKLFMEPWLFPTHVYQAIKVLVDAALTYLVISSVGVLLFTVLYWIIEDISVRSNESFWETGLAAIKQSCKVYWAYGEPKSSWLAFIETVFRDCIGACMLGKIVSGMMIPNNPIEFSRFFIVTKNYEIKLRYWIMLPVGALLHDSKLCIQLINEDEFYKGEGELRPVTKYECKYSGIRGIRSVTLDREISREILNKLEKEESMYKMVFMLSGALVEGRRYFSEKRYTKEDLLYADDYLSIRKDEYPEGLDRKREIPYKMYMNFNMAYAKLNDDLKIFFKPTKYVKSRKRKLKEKKITETLEIDQAWYNWIFKGCQGRINRAMNRLILRHYDNEKLIFKGMLSKSRKGGKKEV